MQAVIDTLSGGALKAHAPPKSQESLLDFIRRNGRVAPVELATVFDLSRRQLESMLTSLTDADLIRRVVAGNGQFWELLANANCDADSGICTV